MGAPFRFYHNSFSYLLLVFVSVVPLIVFSYPASVSDISVAYTGEKPTNTPFKVGAYMAPNYTDDKNQTDHSHAGHGHESHTLMRMPFFITDFERVEGLFIVCFWLFAASFVKLAFHMIPKLHKNIPESCILIILGLVAGIVFNLLRIDTSIYTMTPRLFFFALLPPIVLEAAYFMPYRAFFDNMGGLMSQLVPVTDSLVYIWFSLTH